MEKALLARARPHMLAAKAREIVRLEVSKGCRPEMSSQPVALEPVYQPILGTQDIVTGDGLSHWTIEAPLPEEQLVRLQVWISPEQRCEWNRSELFLKQLSSVRHRIALEIIGNREHIKLQILCHQDDLAVVRTAFSGQFELCELTLARADSLRSITSEVWGEAIFCDFYPSPPYSHLLTNPEELQRSPYATLLTSLAEIPLPGIGFYQVAFIPVWPQNNWHQNVQTLLDLEYSIKLIGGITTPARYAQQAPSSDLRQMSLNVETKAHNDKPFFAAAVRIGLVDADEHADDLIRSLAVMGSLFQHGGRPLNLITEAEYAQRLSPEQIRQMFTAAVTYRPGFLLNSWELTSLVHIPPPEITEHVQVLMPSLETLPPGDTLASGTSIGTSLYAGINLPVCIPDDMRTKHVHLIGKPGKGKSSTIEYMVLNDIRKGHGVAVLDPHGRLVQRLLCLIPPEHADRVIYIEPSDPDWVPIWNPLSCGQGMSKARIADELVRAFKSVVSGWGDRLEHLLRHSFFALLHLPHSNLLDVSNILRQKSDESHQLRAQLLKVLDNEVAKLFWREDFGRYSSADLFPPQHKLSKLLAGETVSLMLSQSDSFFNLRDIMDTGKILLVDISNVGPEVLEILGCFLLSLLHITALGRRGSPTEAFLPFHIYCDEAHRFLTDAVEDMIAETRKFNVSLTLAHQYLSQFGTRQADALLSVGSTVIFNVDTKDARYLRKDLQDKVEIEDLITLEIGRAIARIDNQVVRVKTHYPLEIPDNHCRERIIAQSRARYCKPVKEVQRAVRMRGEQWAEPLSQGHPQQEWCTPEQMASLRAQVASDGTVGEGDDGEVYGYDTF
ncbi:MAG: type IV secretion system DNA-binding domain-containing protein [Planctomycetes bacterium]|nr:type IV secretion system DNA-binding domain-containing protein [Planctomycetota bacterium]